MTTTRFQDQSLPTTRLTLRTVLLLDAGVSGANGLAYLAGAVVLDGLLGPSAPTLAVLGGFLVLWAVVLGRVAARRLIPPAWAREVAVGNLLWVAGSVVAVFLLDLTPVGIVWCLLQAAVVAAFAVVQLRLATVTT